MNVKERIEAAANEWSSRDQYAVMANKEGAHFGFKLAIEMLRSEEAENQNEIGLGSMEPDDWADWLAKKAEIQK